jgi:hypothetical protein
MLIVSGCHSGPNPLKVEPRQKVLAFIAKADDYAQSQTGIYYSADFIYRRCMINSDNLSTFHVSGQSRCNKIYHAMVTYGQTKTKAFQHITVNDLTNKAVFSTLKKPLFQYYMNRG